MTGRVNSGQLVTVSPIIDFTNLEVGHIVLCKVKGREFLHLIKSISAGHKTFTIGNNKGFINGTIGRSGLYGLCTAVED